MLGTVASQAMNFGVLAILARELGPKTFGVVALASIWIKFLNYFLSQGLGLAIIQRKKLDPLHLDSAFWLTNAMAAVLTIATVISAPWAAAFFSEPSLTDVLRVISLSFIIGGLVTVQIAFMTRNQEFKALAFRTLVGNIAGSLIGVALAFAGAGVWALVAKQLAMSIVMAVILWSASTWRPRFSFSIQHLRELWGFSTKVFARNLIGFVYLEADKILVGRLIGSVDLGFYSNSKQLARMLVNVVRKPVETVALPILSKLQDDRAALAVAICKSQGMMAVLLLPTFVGIAALAPEVVAIALGPDWEFARTPLRYLSLAEAINACSAVAFTAIMAAGRPGMSLLHLGISAISTIIATLIGAQWGVVGISIAMMVNALVYSGSFIVILVAITDVELRNYLKTNLPAILSSLLMAGSVMGLTAYLGPDSHLATRTVGGIITGVVVYALCLRLFSQSAFENARSIAAKAAGLGRFGSKSATT